MKVCVEGGGVVSEGVEGGGVVSEGVEGGAEGIHTRLLSLVHLRVFSCTPPVLHVLLLVGHVHATRPGSHR